MKYEPGTVVASAGWGYCLRSVHHGPGKVLEQHKVQTNDPLFVVSRDCDPDHGRWDYCVLTHNGIVGWVREFLLKAKS